MVPLSDKLFNSLMFKLISMKHEILSKALKIIDFWTFKGFISTKESKYRDLLNTSDSFKQIPVFAGIPKQV